MTNLTPNFTLEELTQSDTATRLGINNTPSQDVISHLKITAAGLEQVRKVLGYPMFVSSGYRSIALNKAVGGVATSAHVQGYAADFVCRKFGTPMQIVNLLKKSGIKFDQCIEEGTWVHISFSPAMRQQVLSATFTNGKATYKVS